LKEGDFEEMDNTKYGKYLVPAPITQKKYAKGLLFNAPKYFKGGPDFWLAWDYVKEPHTMEAEPHFHDYDEIFNIFSADSSDISNFDAEIEFSFGRELEKHVITTPTTVYVPKGVFHCPMVFKRIGKPIIFLNVAFSGEYTKTLLNGQRVGLPSAKK
jgi:hypothetical protein